MTIVICGIVHGIFIGILTFNILTQVITPLNISQVYFMYNTNFISIIFFVILAGLVAAIFPAYHASKISVANQLSKNI